MTIVKHNEHYQSYLPEEAGEYSDLGFEPNDEWLKTATPEQQHELLLTWFHNNYQDPVIETPYTREIGYIYIHGGPYHAEEELYSRFEGLVDEEVIREAIDDIQSDGVYDWAPIHTEHDYDLEFELEVNARNLPYRSLCDRINDISSLAKQESPPPQKALLQQLLYSHLIGALEAYLAETISYWLTEERDVFRSFVSECGYFKEKKFPLSDIFKHLETLEEEVGKYINSIVWHRLDMVVPLFCSALRIEKPNISSLMKHIVTRHDIVHRGGKTKEGDVVHIDDTELADLQVNIVSFADKIEQDLSQRFPEHEI